MTASMLRDICATMSIARHPNNHPRAWPVFAEMMKPYALSADEVKDAWHWFLRGWYAK